MVQMAIECMKTLELALLVQNERSSNRHQSETWLLEPVLLASRVTARIRA